MVKTPAYTCKMTLVDKKFGAEVVTKKGKVYKFDDLNCMIKFYQLRISNPKKILPFSLWLILHTLKN